MQQGGNSSMPYQRKIYRPFATVAITAALVGSFFTPIAKATSFSDINEHSHKNAILALVDQGIIKGYPDGTFKPYDSITRGDAAVMIARTFGLLDGKNIPSANFIDLHKVNPTTQEAIAKLT